MLTPDQIKNTEAKVLDGEDTSSVTVGLHLPLLNGHSYRLAFSNEAVFVSTTGRQTYAVLNDKTASLLHDLRGLGSCQFEVYLDTKDLPEILRYVRKTERDAQISFDVVIFGSRAIHNVVGRMMSRENLWLQAPKKAFSGFEYVNPQELNFDAWNISLGIAQSSDTSYSALMDDHLDVAASDDVPKQSSIVQTQLREKVTKVLNSLSRPKSSKKVEADVSIKTKLLE